METLEALGFVVAMIATMYVIINIPHRKLKMKEKQFLNKINGIK